MLPDRNEELVLARRDLGLAVQHTSNAKRRRLLQNGQLVSLGKKKSACGSRPHGSLEDSLRTSQRFRLPSCRPLGGGGSQRQSLQGSSRTEPRLPVRARSTSDP